MKLAIITTAVLVGAWVPLPSLAIQTMELVEHDSTTLTGTFNGSPLSSFGMAPINVAPNEWFVPLPGNFGGLWRAFWEEPGEPDRVNVIVVGFDLGKGIGVYAFSDVPLNGMPDLSARIGLPLAGLSPFSNGSTAFSYFALPGFTSAPYAPGPFNFSFTDAEPVSDSGSTFSLGVISAAALAGTRRWRSFPQA